MLKFKIWRKSDQWLLRYSAFNIWSHLPLEVVFHLRLSSLQPFLMLVWSPELKLKIWGKSDQWLLRYLTFNIMRLSSIGGSLCFKHFWFWFGPLSLSLKFEENPISGCWNIQLLIFWGHLTLEIVFILNIFDFSFGLGPSRTKMLKTKMTSNGRQPPMEDNLKIFKS